MPSHRHRRHASRYSHAHAREAAPAPIQISQRRRPENSDCRAAPSNEAPEKSFCTRDRRWLQRKPARRKVNASLFLLQVPAEFVTHRREQLVRKIGGAARAEALIECGGKHLRRHAFVDRSVDRPAALARIRYAALEFLQLGIAEQRVRRKIQQPRRHYAATAPDL